MKMQAQALHGTAHCVDVLFPQRTPMRHEPTRRLPLALVSVSASALPPVGFGREADASRGAIGADELASKPTAESLKAADRLLDAVFHPSTALLKCHALGRPRPSGRVQAPT